MLGKVLITLYYEDLLLEELQVSLQLELTLTLKLFCQVKLCILEITLNFLGRVT